MGLIQLKERNMHLILSTALIFFMTLAAGVVHADDAIARAEALRAITQVAPAQRLKGIERLLQVGTMADTDAVLLRLSDPNLRVRVLASAVAWSACCRCWNSGFATSCAARPDRSPHDELIC